MRAFPSPAFSVPILVGALFLAFLGCGVFPWGADPPADDPARNEGSNEIAAPRRLNATLRAHAERGSLEPGMTAHAVVELLGNPAREYQCHAHDHDERWVYLTLEGPVDFYLHEGRLVDWEAGRSTDHLRPSPHPEFWLPRRQHVRALVFAPSGACVDTLLDEIMPIGSISLRWDGHPRLEGTRDGEPYLCRIVTEDTTFTRRLPRLR